MGFAPGNYSCFYTVRWRCRALCFLTNARPCFLCHSLVNSMHRFLQQSSCRWRGLMRFVGVRNNEKSSSISMHRRTIQILHDKMKENLQSSRKAKLRTANRQAARVKVKQTQDLSVFFYAFHFTFHINGRAQRHKFSIIHTQIRRYAAKAGGPCCATQT